MATERPEESLRLRETLALIAPGTPLRDGLERILRGRTGALIVLGFDKVVDGISTGGFDLGVPFTATGLRELAKMDGAIIIDTGINKIIRAAVHLMPDHTIPSTETGTRQKSECDWTVGPVPPDKLFVMGDNRTDSADSRYHLCKPGADPCTESPWVPEDDVVGKVFALVWPKSRWTWITRPSVFNRIPNHS